MCFTDDATELAQDVQNTHTRTTGSSEEAAMAMLAHIAGGTLASHLKTGFSILCRCLRESIGFYGLICLKDNANYFGGRH